MKLERKLKRLKYPIKFEPILKEKIWGGKKLLNLLEKKSNKKNIGESWEISDVEGDTSIVSNGALKGKTLKELIIAYKGDLVGAKVYAKFGANFPLLIKFIDAKTTLSIQLHPHDALAKERYNSFGKTEMWYVTQADKNAEMIVGFKNNITPEKYISHLENKTLPEILNFDEVEKGDIYIIPAGRIHAIGAGVMVAEIQQTSDVTYRVYDWDRVDANGKLRDLHTEKAFDAIDYSFQENYKTDYTKNQNKSSEIISCPYFTTHILPIKGTLAVNHQDKDSFVIYMCVEGEVVFHCEETFVKIKKGETVLIPSVLKEFTIIAANQSELLEIFIEYPII